MKTKGMEGFWEKNTDILYHMIEVLCKAIFVVMVLSISAAVTGRFVFRKTPVWSEELGILCLVWLCFLTAQLAVRDGNHIRMTIVEYIIPKALTKILHKGAYLVLLVINVLWTIFGMQVIQLTINNKMPSTRLSMAFLYIPVVLGGVTGIFMVIGRFIKGEW